MDLSPRSMAAVGMGVHPFRDPAITDEFAAERVAIDVAEFHVYAADCRPGRVDFLIDGQHVKTVDQAPDYPMQMMIAAFDFPGNASSARDADHVPALVLDYVRGHAPIGKRRRARKGAMLSKFASVVRRESNRRG
jgi:hypothetical protein